MYRQRDVLLLPVPYTDLTSQKVRPVIVLSVDTYNRGNDDMIVAAITSQGCGRAYEITLTPEHMESGRLPRTSYVRADKIYALSQDIVRRQYGAVSEAFYEQMVKSIDKLISLPERI